MKRQKNQTQGNSEQMSATSSKKSGIQQRTARH